MTWGKRNSAIRIYQAIPSVLFLAALTASLSPEVSPAASDLPSSQQVLAFLTESIDWYRHRAVERQIATDPVDLVFLEDNRQLAGQIVRLSFDFAKADTSFAATSRQITRKRAPRPRTALLIVSALGYFMLVGRHGIKLGDRVQISGMTGGVTDIGWLQFQVREIDKKTQQPTGQVVTFPNSFVLASGGLGKFNREDLKQAQLAATEQRPLS